MRRITAYALVIPVMIGLGLRALAGAPTANPSVPLSFYITVGTEQAPYESVQLENWPDTILSYVKSGNKYEFVVNAGQSASWRLTGTNFDDLRPEPKAPVFTPTGPGTAAFDNGYVGMFFVTRRGRELVGLYHAEDWNCPPNHYLASIGIALSADDGHTWTRRGQLITGLDAINGCSAREANGAGIGAATLVGSDVYVYYTDWNTQMPDAVHLARVSLLDVGNRSDTCQKWNQSSFSTPCAGGMSTPVITPPSAADMFASTGSVSFNTYLDRYLLLTQTSLGVYYATSTDAIYWSALTLLVSEPCESPGTCGYFAYLSPDQRTSATTSASGYLFYANGAPQHELKRRPVTIIGQ